MPETRNGTPPQDEDLRRMRTVAARQSFGPHFDARSTDATAVELLHQGRIRLHPHPEWQLPDEPTWEENPFGNRNWAAQFQMLRWLEPARRAAADGDVEAARIWERYARSWVDANPPGASPSPWAWSDMVEAVRGFVLVAGLLVVDDPRWVVSSLEQHGAWLEDEQHLGRANHALHQHEALFVIGTVLRHERWVDTARTRLERLLVDSYDEQGVNAEGSPAYHDLNYRWWSRALRRLELEGEPPLPHADRLAAAPSALAHATRPDGQYESIGDGDGGRPRGLDHPATRYVSTEGADGEPPAELVAVYDRGYVFGRSGWGETDRKFVDETFYSVSFGWGRRVHGHQDGGAVTYFAGGREWLVDAGKYFYGEHPVRDYVLTREAHNVPHVVGRRYDRTRVVELVRRSLTAARDHLAFEDHGYDGAVVRREVTFDRRTEALVVVDDVRSAHEVEVQQRWLLAPDVEVRLDDDRLELVAGTVSASLHLLTGGEVGLVRGATEPHRGWKATGWGTAEPATQVSVSHRGAHVRVVSLVLPPGRPDLRPVGEVRVSADALTVDLSDGTTLEVPTATDGSDGSGDPATGRRDATPTVEEVVAAVVGARREAWSDGTGAPGRAALAARLRTDFPAVLAASTDHGLRATVADLEAVEQDSVAGWRRPLVAWPGTGLSVGEHPVTTWQGLPDTLRVPAEPHVLSVDLGGLTLPTLVRRGDGSRLTVLFHGALNRATTALPRFERVRTHAALGDSILAVGDPTLDLDRELRLAWYLGTQDLDLPVAIAALVRAAARDLGTESVALAGGSGGGFAALHVASLLDDLGDVGVFAVNPQTDLAAYFPRFVEPAVRAAFRGAPPPSARTSVLGRMRERAPRFRLYYVQNTGDRIHLERHRDPFLRGVAAEVPGVDVRSVEIASGAGHVGPGPEEYDRLWRDFQAWTRPGR